MHWKWVTLAAPVCGLGLVGLLRADPVPDVVALQTAYERQAAAGDKRHDNDLRVLAADCIAEPSKTFLCWIKFVSRNDASQRLFFDAVTVSRGNGAWELKSGLCKS